MGRWASCRGRRRGRVFKRHLCYHTTCWRFSGGHTVFRLCRGGVETQRKAPFLTLPGLGFSFLDAMVLRSGPCIVALSAGCGRECVPRSPVGGDGERSCKQKRSTEETNQRGQSRKRISKGPLEWLPKRRERLAPRELVPGGGSNCLRRLSIDDESGFDRPAPGPDPWPSAR